MILQGRNPAQGVTGADVTALQVELAQLGYTIPAAETQGASFGAGTLAAVQQFQTGASLPSNGTVDTATAAALTEAILDATYIVTGLVVSPTQPGVGGLTATLVDKNVGGDVVLATGTTDTTGRFTLSTVVAARVLATRHKAAPDLQVKVALNNTPLGVSAVAYDGPKTLELDVALPATVTGLATEHEALSAAIATIYPGSLSALQEADQQQDITHLANKTGWDARTIAMAALAAQFSQASGTAGAPTTTTTTPSSTVRGTTAPAPIPAALFYALFRAGLPGNADGLYQASGGTVQAIWQQAIARGTIPASLSASVPAAVQRFQTQAATHILAAPPPVGLSTMQAMVAPILTTAAQQQQFAGLYTQYRDDRATFWTQAQTAFGATTAARLKFAGQLHYLTANNAPLVAALTAAENATLLASTQDLALRGYHDPAKWLALVGTNVPSSIPGADPATRQSNYASVLAAQVRLSHPTATLAHLVGAGALTMTDTAATTAAVQSFLTANLGQFEVGLEPIDAFVARAKPAGATTAVVAQIKRLQRVYQITQDDTSMAALLANNLDSAYAVTRYDQAGFVRAFSAKLGGDDHASAVHARSKQIVHTVLNVAVGYITARSAPVLGGKTAIHVPFPAPTVSPNLPLTAHPTLESLFGSMDYCACSECRSILGPAAYLVDLLHYVDQPSPTPSYSNPQDVLFSRRPDLQYLPLTCENTNTALPYIDVVNETLEYFVANKLSIAGFQGYDTGTGVTSAELLACPQNVDDNAYATLQTAYFPPPLPYNRPLELLRQHMNSLGISLPDAMAVLRASDAVQRPPTGYAWLDILIEQLAVSRDEYALFTDPTLKLQGLYGFQGLADAAVLNTLQSMTVQAFTRRTGVSYDELSQILATRFANPGAVLLPALEALGASFATLAALKSNPSSAAQFQAGLPAGLDATAYGGKTPNDLAAVTAWVVDPANFPLIMDLIVMMDISGGLDSCSGNALQLRYANPDNTANKLSQTDLTKLMLFIRLWKKLGLTIPETDAVLAALFPAANLPSGTNDAANVAGLATGFLTFLPRYGFLMRIQAQLGLDSSSLARLLACWAPIDTTGTGSLYASMFLTPTLIRQDPAFAIGPSGAVLANYAEMLPPHAATLCAAFNLTGAEFSLIVGALGYNATTPLSLQNISAIFRIGWLAHTLSISVAEFLLTRQFVGLDPFAPLDPGATAPAEPPAVRLVRLLQALNNAGLPPVQALYLIWNQDIAGTLAPPATSVRALAWTLRSDFAAVDAQFQLVDDPDGSIAKGLMTLVYGASATETFFGLLNNTLSVSTPCGNPTPTLLAPIVAASVGRLAYDDLAKQLSFAGYLDAATKAAIDAAITANGNLAALHAALAALATANQAALGPYFAAYPELLPLYRAYEASNDPPQTKRTAVLAGVLPTLKQKRKQEQALAEATAAAGTDPGFAQALLRDPTVLHAQSDPTAPAVADFTAVETQGLTVSFWLANNMAVAPDQTFDTAANLAYGPTGNPLPAGQGGGPIAAQWSGYLDAPQDGFYNISVDADAGAQVGLTVAGAAVAMAASGLIWRNTGAIALTAGTLTPISITVASTKTSVTISWQSQGLGWQVIPSQYQYSATLVDRLGASYTRFFKAVSLASALSLAASELAWLGADPTRCVNTTDDTDNVAPGNAVLTPASMANITVGSALVVDSGAAQETVTVLTVTATTFTATMAKAHNGQASYFPIVSQAAPTIGRGWLNALAVSAPPAQADATRLGSVLSTVLGFARIKAGLSPNDQRLLAVMQNPAATLPNGGSALLALTGWAQDSVNALLTQFFGDTQLGHLGDVDQFARVFDAYAVVAKGRVTAAAMLGATTNAPTPAGVTAFQSALRALYADADWLTAVKPINDAMRIQQRDALVAYILQQLGDAYAKQTAIVATTADTPTGTAQLALASGAGLSVGMLLQGPNIAPGATVKALSGTTATMSLGVVADLPSGTVLTFAPANASAIDTPDALYEYFLFDTLTQPPVETSRVRLALSVVQLFIERVLRNLEPSVLPSDIDGSLWIWMKRYRVWQANREVFLWPENWLYPELRDDQSELFKSATSALLQSDIDDDAAAGAYMDYLTGLEQVAKLEPCGIYHMFPTADTAEISYVLGRTAGVHRKYYFRTLENATWSPWAEVKIDADDLPVTPIMWNGRLFLFWLKVTKKIVQRTTEPEESNDPALVSTKLSGLKMKNLTNYATTAQSKPTIVNYEGVLCWSEFSNGTWQATKTSEIHRPTGIATYTAADANAFEADRSTMRLIPSLLTMGSDDPALMLSLYTPLAPIQLWGGFLLHNTHSLPIRYEDAHVFPAYSSTELRTFDPIVSYHGGALNGTLTIHYATVHNDVAKPVYANPVLTFSRTPRTVLPQPDPQSWDAPFFYEDRRNVFYVTTDEQLVPLVEFDGFGALDISPAMTGGRIAPPLLVLPDGATPLTRTFGSEAGLYMLTTGARATPPPAQGGAPRVAVGGGAAVSFAGRLVLPSGSVAAPSTAVNPNTRG